MGDAKGIHSSLYGIARVYLTERLNTHRFCEEIILPDKRAWLGSINPIHHLLPPTDKGDVTIDCRTEVSAFENDELADMILSVNDHAINSVIQQIRRRISILDRSLVTPRGKGKSYIHANFNPKYVQYAITILRTYYNFCLPSKGSDKKMLT
ncbi:hypothetical protein ACFVHQ_05300 [Actinomycetes bacterium NPDC127524]